MSILVNRPDNPRRPPDWRWQRAVELVDNNDRLVPSRDDIYVRSARKLRQLLNRCRSDRDRLAALDANPPLYEAYSIYEASNDPTEHRWELEARLLANEHFDEITAKTGISAATIRWYERLFFDVLSRLKSPSLIIHTVIGRAVQTGLAEREYDCLWKLLGYWAGSPVLDTFIYKFPAAGRADNAEGVSAYMQRLLRSQLEMKATLSAITMPVNWQTRFEILNCWSRMLELEANTGRVTGTGVEAFLQNVNEMLQNLTWTRYAPNVNQELSGPATELESSGARVRATELVMLGTGKPLQELEHLLATAKFPDTIEADKIRSE